MNRNTSMPHFSRIFDRTFLRFFLVVLVGMIPVLSAFAVRTDDPDYPKVDVELLEAIKVMPAGIYEGKVKMPWRMFIPPSATPEKKLPLVVALHGAGRRGTDNSGPMSLFPTFFTDEAQAKHPAFLLVPQIDKGKSWAKPGPGNSNIVVDKVPISPEMETVFALVEETIKKYPIDTTRVYVLGQSLGGFGTWDAITRRPDLWAAAVPICGGGDPSKAALFKNIPIWAWHGANDKAVPPENTRLIIEALKKEGATPRYSEVKAGHGCWVNAFDDKELYEWLFAQKKP